jgi:hypothetical protein
MAEEWRSIPEFEGLYEVSSEGRVRSLPRRTTRGGIRALTLDSFGYSQIALCRDGIKYPTRVHVLVAAAFLGSRPDRQEIRHLDGDPSNSHPSNLAYGTPTENVLDTVRHGRHHNARKTRCKHGHSFEDPANVMWRRNGWRDCRTCHNARKTRQPQLSEAPS